MDEKEIKSLLKQARESIRKKEYKDAMRHAMAVLKEDKDNYNALVFVGVAAEGMKETSTALASYRKAVAVDESQVLAWQGLCSVFEKSEEKAQKEELIGVYETLMVFHAKDPSKKSDLQNKLIKLLEELQQYKKAFAQVQQVIDCQSSECTEWWQKLVHLSSFCSNLSPEDVNMVVKGYGVVLAVASENQVNQLITDYLMFICKAEDVSVGKLVTECSQLKAKYPQCIATVPFLAHVYVFCITAGSAVEGIDSASVKQQLDSDQTQPVSLLCWNAWHHVLNRNYTEAKQILLKALQDDGSYFPAFLMLSQAYLGLHDLVAAEKCLQKVVVVPFIGGGCSHKLNDHNMPLYGLLTVESNAKHLLGTKDLCTFGVGRTCLQQAVDLMGGEITLETATETGIQTVLKMCDEIGSVDVDKKAVLSLKARCLIHLSRLDSATQVIERLKPVSGAEAACLEGLVFVKRENWTQAEHSFVSALEENPSNATVLFNLGKIYWQWCREGGDYQEKCLTYLLKAAKADPNYHLCFLYLGQYYEHIQKDINKAKKCYQKAYNLDSKHEETGICLVDALNTLGQEESALAILLSVTRQASAGCSKWAWLRLGLYQMKHDDPTKAIVSLQSALRADTKDYHCWECLGEAYLNRGSYTAACKAFTKAIELQPTNIYSAYQIANIKLTLGVYPEAVTDFKQILEGSPDYVPALKGLGETYLLQAKQFLGHFFHGRAVDSCTEAIMSLTRAAHIRPGFSCLWKLLGDCCTVLHVVPKDLCILSVPAILLDSGKSLQDTTRLEKTDVMALGSRCYGMALKTQPDSAALWHDLAVNYYQRACKADKLTSVSLMTRAFQAVEKALQHDGNSHKHWNLLGLVAQSKELDNKALAQHSFIKSIQLEQSNAVAWSNLGVLYLRNDDIKLAHEAFKVAQSLEPSYVASWIGQALIAETVGQSEEALDLFRHTTELSTHAEGALGYAHWVCQILQDKQKSQTDWSRYIIEHMHAVTAASDVLAKYLERVRDNPAAFNFYGLILERQKLYKGAAEAFGKAVRILQESKGLKEELQKAKLNLARVLVNNGEHERAIALFQEVGVCTFSEQCSFALALYKMGAYEESYAQYIAALKCCDKEEDKSHVFAALGMIKYRVGAKEMGKGDIDGAKTDLFKCIQSSPPSVYGLNGLLSLGLIQGDLTLAIAAVQELQHFVQKGESHGFTYMVASLHALKGELAQGKRELCKLIHCRPDLAAGWSYLVQFSLTHETDLTQTVTRCCQIAHNHDVKMEHENLTIWLALALLGTGQHARKEKLYNSHSAAQKAVLLYPDKLESWVGLIAGMYAEMVVLTCMKQRQKLQETLLPLITHFMAKVEGFLSQKEGNTPRLQALHLWCVKQYVVALLAAGKIEQAQQFLQQALWLYEEDQPLQNILAFLNQNLNTLKISAINDAEGYIRQMLVKLFLVHGLVGDAENTLRMWLPQARTKPRKVLAFVRLAFFAFQQLMVSGGHSEPLRAVFTEACEECLKIDHHNFVVHLLSGLQALLDKKNKDCKKSLQNALKFSVDKANLSYGKSLARKHLLKCLLQKGDEEDIKALISLARSDRDEDFLAYASKKVNTE